MDQFIKLEEGLPETVEGTRKGSISDDRNHEEGFWFLEEAKVLLLKVRSYDWETYNKSPLFIPGSLAVLGMLMTFWTLTKGAFLQWKTNDYYSHGFIVPILVAWQIRVRKEMWDNVHFKPSAIAWLFLVPLLAAQYLAVTGEFWAVQSCLFIIISLVVCWLIFGFRKALVLSLPIAFVAFALPLWGSLIDGYTNPLQVLSSTVALTILKLSGFNPMKLSPTDIQLNTFTLNVAVPCSGLKLMVAVTCLTCHFILIARAGWLFNVLMAMLVVPLCLLMNGLRIALIGMVGEWNGREAAVQFHDYSGMIMLVLCFFVLFKFAKVFGWNG